MVAHTIAVQHELCRSDILHIIFDSLLSFLMQLHLVVKFCLELQGFTTEKSVDNDGFLGPALLKLRQPALAHAHLDLQEKKPNN